MKINFHKYQGTGNDFVMIDNRDLTFPKSDISLIAKLCDRKFGVGADGLILLENHPTLDFKMVYFNSDGNQSSMCGNGGRCIIAFANALHIIKEDSTFEAIDGLHFATIDAFGLVSLQMKNVEDVKINSNYTFLDTGSPHHVELVNDLQNVDVQTFGSQIRNSDLYGLVGSNVNFVSKINNDTFAIRTYERGVEAETLSCGTGATAVAIAMKAIGQTVSNSINIVVQGGNLKISFEPIDGQFKNVFLTGKAEFVFEGIFNTLLTK